MPSTSAKQENFMRAIAHGWKPTRIKDPPSRAVATEFMEADQGKYAGGFAENRYYTGGLAAMNLQRGGLAGLSGLLKRATAQQEGEPGSFLGTEPLNFQQFRKKIGASGMYSPIQVMATAKKYGWVPDPGAAGGDLKNMTWYPPQPTLTAPDGGGGALPQVPPRIIPTGPPATPVDRRAGRDTAYSEALRAHRQRVASSLSVPEGGYAEGGHVENYQEGGAARAGHAEGANPYPEGSARYKLWERKNHVDPAPPPVAEAAPEPEDISWLDRLLGTADIKGRSGRELEEMGEAYGGYIDAPGYQFGGLAQANFRGPPRGGVPPRVGMMNPRGGIPRFQPGGPGGPFPGGRPGGGLPFPPGKGPRPMVPPSPPGGFPGRRPPPGVDPRGGPAVPGRGGLVGAVRDAAGPAGVPGGPRVPPNIRGYLQRQRMMNRPPANVGGGVNRVGQQDQQGGLARALQRGTGRRPMSRRGGFPGRNIR